MIKLCKTIEVERVLPNQLPRILNWKIKENAGFIRKQRKVQKTPQNNSQQRMKMRRKKSDY
jgi:hypothetical protein